MAMTLGQFEAFVRASVADLQAKQDDLERRFGLDGFARCRFDQPPGLLRFEGPDGRARVEAPYTEVGGFSPMTGTWTWGWANGSLREGPRMKSSRLRSLADLTGHDVFRRGVREADEALAWELTAMAVKHLGAQGAYRCTIGPLQVFLAIEGAWLVPTNLDAGPAPAPAVATSRTASSRRIATGR